MAYVRHIDDWDHGILSTLNAEKRLRDGCIKSNQCALIRYAYNQYKKGVVDMIVSFAKRNNDGDLYFYHHIIDLNRIQLSDIMPKNHIIHWGGEQFDALSAPYLCKNCGTSVSKNFCPKCGQPKI